MWAGLSNDDVWVEWPLGLAGGILFNGSALNDAPLQRFV